MTATRTVTLWCDAPACVEWIAGKASTIADARIESRESGWRRTLTYRGVRGGFDLCPRHAVDVRPGRRS
jgi:hypothetical protein